MTVHEIPFCTCELYKGKPCGLPMVLVGGLWACKICDTDGKGIIGKWNLN